MPQLSRFLCPGVALALIVTLAAMAQAQDGPVQVNIGPAGQGNDEALILVDPNNDPTGVRFLNLGNSSGTVTVTRSHDPLPTLDTSGSPYSGPFRMIDNLMLEIESGDFPDGQKRLGIRVGYEQRALRENGLREGTLHLMKLDNGRWSPAIFATQGGTFDFQPNSPLIFNNGSFGIDQDANYAWATITTNGVYGIAGVPEPAAIGLIGLGSALLLVRGKRDARRA